jgi:hypothetical protein
MDPSLVRAIHSQELLAREQWAEFPETITATDLALLAGLLKP